MSTLNRVLCEKLKHLDVGGDGDCFFRAVSHQLYQDYNYHLYNVRQAGINYIQAHPEQIIESITASWIEYINNMSAQGTSLYLIDITESADNFNDTTVVHPIQHQKIPK